jgi:hypothetical protein
VVTDHVGFLTRSKVVQRGYRVLAEGRDGLASAKVLEGEGDYVAERPLGVFWGYRDTDELCSRGDMEALMTVRQRER